MGREPVNRNNNPYSNELSLEEARQAGDSVSIDFVVEASDLDGDFNALVIFRDSEDKGVVYSLEGKYRRCNFA